MPANTPLDAELSFFEEKRAEWLTHYQGQFALIKGRALLGTYPTQNEAIEAGLTQLGNVPFLVKQVLATDEPIATSPSLVLGLMHAHS
jgi:hypothetical protein